MKKKIILLVLFIVGTIVFCSCKTQDTNQNVEIGSQNKVITGQFELETPAFSGFKIVNMFYLNDNKIILCYRQYGESKSKLVLFNIKTKGFETIYEGDFNLDFDTPLFINNEDFMLQNGLSRLFFNQAESSIEEVMNDNNLEEKHIIYDSKGKYAIESGEEGLFLLNISSNTRSQVNEKSRVRSEYKWRSDGMEFIYIADYSSVVVVNVDTLEVSKFVGEKDFPFPDNLVDYLHIYYTGDEKNIILGGACESNTVYQIIDKSNGSLIAQFEGETPNCTLLDINQTSLLIMDGPKDNSDLFLHNYQNGIKTPQFSAENQFIMTAKLNSTGEQLAMVLMDREGQQQYILIQPVIK